MLIGIISDTHDHIENLQRALALLKEKKVGAIIHCGDFCAPFMIDELDSIGIPAYCVFGNIDDKFLTTRKADASKNVKLYGDIAELELGGKKIAVNHYPLIGESLASTGKYDLVCCGHTHKKDLRKIGDALLLNPGKLMGRFGEISVALYDTETGEAEHIEVKI